MNDFINHMNRLPLYHDPKTSFTKEGFLADLFRLFHSTYMNIDVSRVEYNVEPVGTRELARIKDDLNRIVREIKDYVLTNTKRVLTVKYQKDNIKITVLFSLFSHLDDEIQTYKRYIPWIIHWFSLCYVYSEKKCQHPVRVHLYLTPFEKKLPTTKEILGEPHVNTAFTWHCKPNNKIVLYRNEEWFKVLIHESFHYFSFEDFKRSDENRLKACFPLTVDLEVGEAYGEFWARVLTCFYRAYFIEKEFSRQSSVLTHFYRMMYIERIYSCYQAIKVLNYMNLSYPDLYATTVEGKEKRKSYREKSNVFCYYVLVAVLMNEYQDTMSWCNKYNRSLIKITLTNSHLFVDYIKRICKNDTLLHNLEQLSGIYLERDRTLRMTLMDFL